MYVSGLTSASRASSSRISLSWPENFERQEPSLTPRELVEDHPADVVARRCVLAARVAETCDEQIERRGRLASTEEPHGSAFFVGPAWPAAPRRRRAPRRLGLRSGLALRGLALLALLAPRPPRPRPPAPRPCVGTVTVASTVSGSSSKVTPSGADRSDSRSESPISIALTSSSIRSGTSSGSASTRISRDDLGEHAAGLRPDALADELDDDGRLDRLVEPHLLEVEVVDLPADRIDLVVLEDRRVRRLLALEHDVEDRVQSGGAGQHAAELALGHGDRVRLVPAPVEDAGDHPRFRAGAATSREPLCSRSCTSRRIRSPAIPAEKCSRAFRARSRIGGAGPAASPWLDRSSREGRASAPARDRGDFHQPGPPIREKRTIAAGNDDSFECLPLYLY